MNISIVLSMKSQYTSKAIGTCGKVIDKAAVGTYIEIFTEYFNLIVTATVEVIAYYGMFSW